MQGIEEPRGKLGECARSFGSKQGMPESDIFRTSKFRNKFSRS
jgi:hypothetical protein